MKKEKLIDVLFNYGLGDGAANQCADELLALFSVSCCAFVDEIAPMAEYIKGHHYKDEYRKLMIPVVEYNELKEAAKKFDEKHCS